MKTNYTHLKFLLTYKHTFAGNSQKHRMRIHTYTHTHTHTHTHTYMADSAQQEVWPPRGPTRAKRSTQEDNKRRSMRVMNKLHTPIRAGSSDKCLSFTHWATGCRRKQERPRQNEGSLLGFKRPCNSFPYWRWISCCLRRVYLWTN